VRTKDLIGVMMPDDGSHSQGGEDDDGTGQHEGCQQYNAQEDQRRQQNEHGHRFALLSGLLPAEIFALGAGI
jgi:hypothetical protein